MGLEPLRLLAFAIVLRALGPTFVLCMCPYRGRGGCFRGCCHSPHFQQLFLAVSCAAIFQFIMLDRRRGSSMHCCVALDCAPVTWRFECKQLALRGNIQRDIILVAWLSLWLAIRLGTRPQGSTCVVVLSIQATVDSLGSSVACFRLRIFPRCTLRVLG